MAVDLFNEQWYLEQNPDVAAAVAAGLTTAHQHFLAYGQYESRAPSSLFDPVFYLAQNPDVAAAVEAGLASAYEHFLLYGQGEPRTISPFIDLAAYANANPDLAAVEGLNLYQHLVTYGLHENRDLGNGITLGQFANDPAFNAALADPDHILDALARIAEVAPFLPDFQAPEGWTPPADTPIPTDFVPPEGVQLVVPPTVTVPEGTELPDTFKPVDGGSGGSGGSGGTGGGGGGGGGPAATFTVTETAGVLTFGGTATGIITVTTDGDNVATFSRGGVTAATTPDLDTIIKITVGDGQTLALSAAQAGGRTIDGTGGVVIGALDATPAADLSSIAAASVTVRIEENTDISTNFSVGTQVTRLEIAAGKSASMDVSQVADVGTIVKGTGATVQAKGDGAQVTHHAADLSAKGVDALEITADTGILSAAQASGMVISGAGGVAITGSAGDQTISATSTGGNLIRGGEGKDTVTGGAGDDVLVLVGTTADNQYEAADIPAGLAGVLTLSDLNSRTVSEAVAGESYDGGGGVNTLHVYGTVDMTGISLAGITHVVVHSDVTFAPGQLDGITHITGDGGSTVRLAAGSASTMDLSGITLANIGQLDVGDNVTAQMSQANLNAIATVSSYQDAKIQAALDATLNFAGKNVFGSAEVLKSDGSQQAATLKASGGNDVGAIIETVNGIITSVNITLGAYGMSAYSQTQAVEGDYALMCDKLADMTGASVIQGRGGVQNFLSGGDLNDTLIGGELTNFIYVGSENTDPGIFNTVTGGAARDFIAGDANADTIHGGGGDDFIYGGGGDDHIHGDEGNDFIRPGDGADTVYISSGSDFIDLTETTPATDTVHFTARTGTPITPTPSYILGFDTTSDGSKDTLKFAHEAFIDGSLGARSVIGTGSASEKFDLNTTDFSGLVKITDNTTANFSDFSDASAKIIAAVTNTAANDAFIFAISNGTDMALVLGWDDRAASGGNGNGMMEATEFTQIAILVGVNSVADLDMSVYSLG